MALQDRQGFLWFGTQDGLNRYDGYEFRIFRHSEPELGSLRNNYILSLFEDRAGTLWVGTNKGGLNRYDARTEQFTAYVNAPNDPESLSLNAVNAIVEDPAGYLWVATDGHGLNRFDKKTGKFKRFVNDPAIYENRRANLVNALYLDRSGALWLGTSWGLQKFDLQTNQFIQRFSHDPNNPASLSHNRVQTICEDRAGRLWVGTGGGLNRFDAATQSFQHFTEKDGLVNGNIMGILEDARGQLRLGTMKGVTRFDPATNTMRNYDVTDGLFGNEVTQHSFYQNRAGVLFFGGSEGFNAFRPEQIQDDLTPPPIVLTSCQRYNTDIVEGSALREPGIVARPAIEFSYKDNILTFGFAALSFRHPEKNQYAYQLAGYSDRWVQLGTKREVTFTNLDAGDYTLHVRGANADGIWNMTGTSLRIRIHPPFWRRWWFVSLELLAIVGLVWGAYRYRITVLQRRNAQQQEFARQLIESQEAERKRIAAELHDGLGQNLLVIKNRASLACCNQMMRYAPPRN